MVMAVLAVWRGVLVLLKKGYRGFVMMLLTRAGRC